MSENRAKISNGGYANMIKERKATYQELRQDVDEVLSKWDGGLLCIMRVDEDENGNPTGVHTFVGGVSKVSASLALVETVNGTAETMMKQVKKSAMEGLAEEISNDSDFKELIKMLKEALGKD